jgi:lysophospholipase L1-like esterase
MLAGRPSPASFKRGLYVLEIGGNDYINALRSGLSPSSITTTLLPQVITKIVNATKVRN